MIKVPAKSATALKNAWEETKQEEGEDREGLSGVRVLFYHADFPFQSQTLNQCKEQCTFSYMNPMGLMYIDTTCPPITAELVYMDVAISRDT